MGKASRGKRITRLNEIAAAADGARKRVSETALAAAGAAATLRTIKASVDALTASLAALPDLARRVETLEVEVRALKAGKSAQ